MYIDTLINEWNSGKVAEKMKFQEKFKSFCKLLIETFKFFQDNQIYTF